jgi:uncharacterized protein (TIGR00369 family)
MTTSRASDAYDIRAPDGVETRFGIRLVDYDQQASTAVMSMPLAHMTNPLTQRATLAPLALLTDDVGSTVNFSCRQGRWPVSSELMMAVGPDAMSALDDEGDLTVVAHGSVIGASSTDALASCSLALDETTIASAFVRSVYVAGDAVLPERPRETLVKTVQTSLAELMAVRGLAPEDGNPVLGQLSDPMVWNATAHVHGGVSATALELVAHAAMADQRPDLRFRTGSLRVNFLSPLMAGSRCRYTGTAVRVGSTMAIADGWAEGDDGKVAVVARLTAYADREV